MAPWTPSPPHIAHFALDSTTMFDGERAGAARGRTSKTLNYLS